MINCLVFDLGAGSGRAMLARLEGETLALSEVHRFSGIETSREGGPHWDLDRLLKEVDRGIEIASSLVTRIDAIGVDSWGVDYALLDASGRLEPWPFHYRHPRSQQGFDAFPASPETMFERTGSQSLPVNTVYQLYSASRTDRQALDKSRHALMIADAVNYHLTGIARSNATLARTTGLLSLDGDWDTTIINEAGLPQTLLAPLIEPGAIVGRLRYDIHSKSRATEETLVISVAAHDTASAICGLPVEGDDAFLICGSWSILGRERARPVVSHEAMLDGFGNEGGPDGHILYLKSLNGLHLLQKLRTAWTERTGRTVDFIEMSEAAAEASARGRSEMIDPSAAIFFNPPDLIAAMEDNCPSLAGITEGKLGALTLSVYRGLCQDIARGLEALERSTGGAVKRLRICGGGGQDRLLCQMIASRTGRRVLVGPIEASAWGNAILQLMGLGQIENIPAGRKLVEKSVEILNYYPDPIATGPR
jgi:rhamnulokinase